MKLKLVIVASVAILAIVFITKYFTDSSHKSKAGENDLTFVVSPISGTKDLNQFDITYVIASDRDEKKIGTLSMKFNATGNLQIMSLSEGPKTYREAVDVFQMMGTPTINAIGTTLDFAAVVDQTKKDQAKKSISFKVRVKGKGNGAGALIFDRANSEMGGFMTTSPIVYAISSTSSTDPSFTFSGPSAPSLNFYFDPSITTIGANAENATAVFKIDGTPTGKGITTFETNIFFNKDVSEVESVTPNSVVVEKFDETQKIIDNNLGKIRVNYRGKTSVSNYATSVQFDIRLKRKSTLTANSTTDLSFDQAKANGDIDEISYLVNATNGQLVIQPRGASSSSSSSSSSSQQSSSSSSSSSSHQSSSNSSSTQSSSSSSQIASSSSSSRQSSSSVQSTTPSTSVTMKLLFQGIVSEPAEIKTMNVKIKIFKEGDQSDSYLTVPFTAMTDTPSKGYWKSIFDIPLPDVNAKYYVYVKGPKHIQKKFCDARPRIGGQKFYNCSKANITLQPNENNFLDFTNIKLLAGDLPEQDSVQNGIIDSYDLVLVRTNISNATYHDSCDINMDKKCDWQDWSLVLASMAEKYDE